MFKIKKNLKPNTYNLYPSFGFTLIELLVSIAVILIVSGLSFASYSETDKRQKLISAGQTMKNILRDAQSRSYNGEVDCSICGCSPTTSSTLTGWYVDFTQKKIYGQCLGTNFSETNFGLEDEIVMTPHLTPPAMLLFQSYPPSPSQKATICLSSGNLTGKYYLIYVNEYGDISDESSLTDTCTPQ